MQQAQQDAKTMMELGRIARVAVFIEYSEVATVHVNGYLEQVIDIEESIGKGSMTLDTSSTQIIASMNEVNRNVAQFKL